MGSARSGSALPRLLSASPSPSPALDALLPQLSHGLSRWEPSRSCAGAWRGPKAGREARGRRCALLLLSPSASLQGCADPRSSPSGELWPLGCSGSEAPCLHNTGLRCEQCPTPERSTLDLGSRAHPQTPRRLFPTQDRALCPTDPRLGQKLRPGFGAWPALGPCGIKPSLLQALGQRHHARGTSSKLKASPRASGGASASFLGETAWCSCSMGTLCSTQRVKIQGDRATKVPWHIRICLRPREVN